MSALRNNEGKAELAELLHFDLRWLADHMAAGRRKYPDTEQGTPNWKLGGKPDAEYLNAAVRHLSALVNGEEFDAELKTHHAAAVAWNMHALLTCNRTYGAEQPVQQTLPLAPDPVWTTVQNWSWVQEGDRIKRDTWDNYDSYAFVRYNPAAVGSDESIDIADADGTTYRQWNLRGVRWQVLV